MKIDITFTKFFKSRYWFWTFKRYTKTKGFILRILGLYINIRDHKYLVDTYYNKK
jgi:hypothetical protein